MATKNSCKKKTRPMTRHKTERVIITDITERGNHFCEAVNIDPDIKTERQKTRQKVKKLIEQGDIKATIVGKAGICAHTAVLQNGEKIIISPGEFYRI